jgi:hypothetical protein
MDFKEMFQQLQGNICEKEGDGKDDYNIQNMLLYNIDNIFFRGSHLQGVVSPRPSPVANHVLKEIVIMFYRLVSQVFISWWLMCLLGQGA